MRVPPPIITLGLALAMYGLDYVSPTWLSFSGLVWFSGLFALGAIIFLLPAVAQFVRSNTTVNPYTPQKSSKLVDDGVYRFSRNPMYLGMALALASWASYLENILSYVFVFFFISYMTRFQILFEEEALLEKFNVEFEAYCKRGRRWL